MKILPKRVTVAELIISLGAYPPDMPVLIDGYEGGYDYPYPPTRIVVGRAYADDDVTYFGRFAEDEDGEKFHAVVLAR
jgi:hypothetical protein